LLSAAIGLYHNWIKNFCQKFQRIVDKEVRVCKKSKEHWGSIKNAIIRKSSRGLYLLDFEAAVLKATKKLEEKTSGVKKSTISRKSPLKVGLTSRITHTGKTNGTKRVSKASNVSKDKLVKALITSDNYTASPTKVLKKVIRRSLSKDKLSRVSRKNETAITETKTKNESKVKNDNNTVNDNPIDKPKPLFNIASRRLQNKFDPLNKLEALKQAISFAMTHPQPKIIRPSAAEILNPPKPLSAIEKLKLALKENMAMQKSQILNTTPVEMESTTPKEELSAIEKLTRIFAANIFGKALVKTEDTATTSTPLPTTTEYQEAEQVNAFVKAVDRLKTMLDGAKTETETESDFLSQAVNRLKSLLSAATQFLSNVPSKEETNRTELEEQIRQEDSEVLEYMQTLGYDTSRISQGNEDIKEGSGGNEETLENQDDTNVFIPNSRYSKESQPEPVNMPISVLEVIDKVENIVEEPIEYDLEPFIVRDDELDDQNEIQEDLIEAENNFLGRLESDNPDPANIHVGDLEVGDQVEDDMEKTASSYQTANERETIETENKVPESEEKNQNDNFDVEDDLKFTYQDQIQGETEPIEDDLQPFITWKGTLDNQNELLKFVEKLGNAFNEPLYSTNSDPVAKLAPTLSSHQAEEERKFNEIEDKVDELGEENPDIRNRFNELDDQDQDEIGIPKLYTDSFVDHTGESDEQNEIKEYLEEAEDTEREIFESQNLNTDFDVKKLQEGENESEQAILVENGSEIANEEGYLNQDYIKLNEPGNSDFEYKNRISKEKTFEEPLESKNPNSKFEEITENKYLVEVPDKLDEPISDVVIQHDFSNEAGNGLEEESDKQSENNNYDSLSDEHSEQENLVPLPSGLNKNTKNTIENDLEVVVKHDTNHNGDLDYILVLDRLAEVEQISKQNETVPPEVIHY
jgi:hypothetical protein